MRFLYCFIPSFAYYFSKKERQTWDSLRLIPKSSSIGNNLDFVGHLGVNIPTNPVLEDSRISSTRRLVVRSLVDVVLFPAEKWMVVLLYDC